MNYEAESGLPENIFEDKLVSFLAARGPEDLEARQALEEYVDKCHAEADAEVATNPDYTDISNRANIKAEIKIGRLGLEVESLREAAIESLTLTLMAASQSSDTADLAGEIEKLLS